MSLLYAPLLFIKHRVSLVLLLFALIAVLTGCAVNPVTGKSELAFVSEEKEIQLGAENYIPAQQSQGGQYNVDPSITAYVRSVGQKLVAVSDRPQLPFEFVVLNNSVPNAWAMPGGKLAINRGLLIELDNEAELAAVLGHEIVHATARHGAKAMERGLLLQVGTIGLGVALADDKNSKLLVGTAAVGAALINQKYSREHELESDFYGMKYMVKAGYDPQAAVTLQEKFTRLAGNREPFWLEGLFASHPPSQERVEKNKATLATFPKGGRIGRDTYQKKIAHLKQNKKAYDDHDKGKLALEKGNSQLALQLADQALKIEPREAMFLSLRGDGLAAQGKSRLALDAYNQAIQQNPDYFYHYLKRGLLHKKLDKPQQAKSDLEKSNQLMPTSPAHYGLGELALAANQRANALNHFKMAATSESAVGKKAGKQFARLEITNTPEKYINVAVAQAQSGRLLVKVHNLSPITVKKLTIEIHLIRNTGQLIKRELIYVPGPLKPNDKQQSTTQIKISSTDIPFVSVKTNILSIATVDDI